MPIEAAEAGTTPSLREALEANHDAIVATESATAAPAASTPASPDASAQTVAGPVRDEQGRFAEKTVEKPAPVTAVQPAPASPAYEPVKPPSSWKKDYWPHWEKLTKGDQLSKEEAQAIAKYTLEREGDFIKGVSAYKGEFDRAKPVLEALHPYRELIEQNKMRPEQFVTALAETHRTLTTGGPEDKLRAFAKFAQDYQIPLHQLLVQGEDGKVYLNQNYFTTQQPAQQPGLTAADVDKVVAQRFAQLQINTAIQNFVSAKDASGNPLHPHFDEVKETAFGLLRAGLAKDLPTAYQAALDMPQHSSLLAAQQQQQRATEEAEKQKQAAAAAQRAKSHVVSPKNQAPTGLVTDKKNGSDLRAVIESAVDAHSAGSRV